MHPSQMEFDQLTRRAAAEVVDTDLEGHAAHPPILAARAFRACDTHPETTKAPANRGLAGGG
ncbi:hypothetical protein GCM10027515_10940 [Schumannella luteola]